MSSEAQTSYHGIAARLDRIPITGMHRKVLWLLAGITFCDSVDMGVGGPIGAVLQSTYDAAGNQWMTLEQYALFNSITMIGYLVGGLMAGALSDGIGRKKAVLICGSIFTAFCFVAAGSPRCNVPDRLPLLHGSGPWRCVPRRLLRTHRVHASHEAR